MPGRLEWTAALERESLRATRYARPAAVAIIELRPLRGSADDDPWLRTLAAPVARVLRRDSRSTDVVARVASGRFQVLLPETSAAGADQYAERIGATCRTEVGASGAAVTVRICVAAVTRGRSLADAVEEALRSIAAA
jgi:GGDEF domain-containing protein